MDSLNGLVGVIVLNCLMIFQISYKKTLRDANRQSGLSTVMIYTKIVNPSGCGGNNKVGVGVRGSITNQPYAALDFLLFTLSKGFKQ